MGESVDNLDDDIDDTLQREGVVLLRQWSSATALAALLQVAGSREYLPLSHSINAEDLPAELIEAPLRESRVGVLPRGARRLRAHCWVRRRYAPVRAPKLYAPNTWHQDGALKLPLPDSPTAGPMPPLQPLLTIWAPLHDCADDSPTLEFVRSVENHTHHWTQLSDSIIREHFAPDRFWIPPALQLGDALLFLPGTLHRTHVTPAMTKDRTSVEYRFATGPCRGLEPEETGAQEK